MNRKHLREYISRNGKCPLCEKPLGTQSAFAHEKAGRVHLFCSFNPELWKKWMQRTGMIPTPVKIEVVDDKE